MNEYVFIIFGIILHGIADGKICFMHRNFFEIGFLDFEERLFYRAEFQI